MSPTILELAANVRQQKAELDALCKELRAAGGEWTTHALASDEAMKIADDGLRNCWCMLDRLKNLAREEIARRQQPNAQAQGRPE